MIKLIDLKLFLLLLLLLPSVIFAQKSQKSHIKEKEEDPFPKIELGLNFGGYIANKYSAAFYNGADGNVNTVSYVLSNKFWYEEIKKELIASDTVILRGLPQNMHYNVALTGGIFFRMNISRNNSIFLEANYVKLKTDDAITIEVDPLNNQFPDLRVFGIHGSDERINIDLGYHRKFPVFKNKMNVFLQGGMNLNYVKVLKSSFNINNKEYSIINIYGNRNYVPGGTQQELSNEQGGFGYGIVGGGGLGFTFTPRIGLEVGGKVNYSSVNLEGYDQMKPSFIVYLRFMLTGIIFPTDE